MNSRLFSGFSCRDRFATIFVVGAIFFTMNAWSIEPLDEAFPLWADDISLDGRFVGFDIDSATPGIEIIIGGESEETLLPPVSNKVRGRVKTKIRIFSEDGSTFIRDLPIAGVTSLPYPDPGDPQFQDGGAFPTFYQAGEGFGFSIPFGTDAATARQMVIERVGFPLGFGIAETSAGTVRTFIFGIGIGIMYSNSQDGDVDASQFAWLSFDAGTGTLLCQKHFPGTASNGWRIETGVAGVANYLSSAGRGTEDEIRIERELELTGLDLRNFRFYDPRSCALLSSNVRSAPNL